MADAEKLLRKIKNWQRKRDDPALRNTSSFALNKMANIRDAAMLDIFGHPWLEFSSADDQTGDILDLLEEMLEKFVGEEILSESQ